MMSININIQYFPQIISLSCIHYGNSYVIKNTEATCRIPSCMMQTSNWIKCMNNSVGIIYYSVEASNVDPTTYIEASNTPLKEGVSPESRYPIPSIEDFFTKLI